MTKKKKRKKKRLPTTYNKRNLKKAILGLLYEQSSETVNYKQISSALGIRDPEIRKLVYVVLEDLYDDNYLDQVSRGKYRLRSKGGYIVGTVDLQPQGFAYINSNESDDPVLVSSRNLNHAMQDDKVRILLYAKRKKHEPEGEVVEIIERAKSVFVGTVSLSENYCFLIPSGQVGFDIFIAWENRKGAKNGQKAIARILDWPPRAKSPFGEITDILGDTGDNDAEMHAILAEYDLPYKFPDNVEKAAKKIPMNIPPEEYKTRRDVRNIPTFTIDPADAKDFDDALSFRKLEKGLYEIGVHIADVSYYVNPNTLLDEEAFKRATSVYLVDRVVPMLPERLSNGVCSLRPDEDKLCFSAIFKTDANGEVKHQWFGKTVIRSDRRFTYEEAQKIIDTGEGEMKEEILELNKLALKLRAGRFKEGSIAFDRVEIMFEIDEQQGKPLSVYFKEAKEANNLIEEFMLLANKRVAEFIGKPKGGKSPKTFVYRIHDKPDIKKLESFNYFIRKFGYSIHLTTPRMISDSLNKLLTHVKGKKEQDVIENLAVRAMAKAEYSTRNIGHYGLSFDHYTHFTSPIRRYPDIMVHRLLERYRNGERSVNAQKYEEKCRHASGMETKAANAERTSVKYKQVEFMQDHIGEIYKGVISGITGWGIYVELENKIEGMIPIRELDDDFYVFDERNYALVGRHSRKKYQLGDDLNVKIWRTNLERKQLDLKPAPDKGDFAQ